MATITVTDSMSDQMNRDAAIRKVWWRLIPFRVGNARHNKMPPPRPSPASGRGRRDMLHDACHTGATTQSSPPPRGEHGLFPLPLAGEG